MNLIGLPFASAAKKRIIRALPDPVFYRYRYFQAHGRLCNFKEPQTFSEKIYHRMRYPASVFSRLADKVGARSYVAEVAGSQYLVPVYFWCDHVTPATFSRLPNAFVMKANHSAGQVRIVRDKRRENLADLARLAEKWLASKFYARAREKHYRDISPKIIFERPLLEHGQPPDDYKFNVFNPADGSPPYVFIQHMQDRFGDDTQDIYLKDWTPAAFQRKGQRTSTARAPKPPLLREMLRIATRLAKPFGYLRVDFYLHEGRIYLGELTLTPGRGGYTFDPPEWDAILGKKFGWPEQV